MANEKPDTAVLIKAIQRLEESVSRYERDVRDTQIRDGLIQRTEFPYDELIYWLKGESVRLRKRATEVVHMLTTLL